MPLRHELATSFGIVDCLDKTLIYNYAEYKIRRVSRFSHKLKIVPSAGLASVEIGAAVTMSIEFVHDIVRPDGRMRILFVGFLRVVTVPAMDTRNVAVRVRIRRNSGLRQQVGRRLVEFRKHRAPQDPRSEWQVTRKEDRYRGCPVFLSFFFSCVP